MPLNRSSIKNLSRFTGRLGAILADIGVAPRRLLSIRHIPKYCVQYVRFKALGGVITHRRAIFSDYDNQAGSARGHYFHQDLLVASLVHRNNPVRHVDIGSRIDGFVAHVASFRQIDIMDIRELRDTGHKNIAFVRTDLMNEACVQSSIADSISCLHAIEHFGLGRYGDPVDPAGHLKGFRNILRMLQPGGRLYISFPIGPAHEVHFNAHRVFDPRDIFNWPQEGTALRLERFDYVDDAGNLHRNVDLAKERFDVQFGCGIYVFRKGR